MTPLEARNALLKLGLDYEKEPFNAVRRAATKWRSLTIRHEQTHGLIRSLLGSYKVSQFPPIVNKLRTIKSGATYMGGLKLNGLSALQEQGGRTKAHIIKGGWGRAFVEHPGSTIASYPSASLTLPLVEAFLAETLDKGVARAIAKAGLAS